MVEERLRGWVEALCSPACAGRRPGTPEGAAARAVIVDAFRGLGLAPALQAVPASGGHNVVARVGPGRTRVVLVGAHYDHLGRGVSGEVYWGADDNAAAVALVVEVGRALAAAPPAAGDVLLVAFDAEESPFFMTEGMGAVAFTRAPPVPLEDIELMIGLDLVGHAVGADDAPPSVRQTLLVLGAEKSEGTPTLVAHAAAGVAGLVVRQAGIDVVPPLSDYEPFRRAGVPFLFLTCGRWRHYHRPTDTPDVLDYSKLAAATRFVERLVRAALDERTARPRYDDAARDQPGTIDSFTALLAALAPTSPRAQVGLKILQDIRARVGPDGRVAMADWSTVLQLVMVLEQGLA
jgi:hypothetical protein